MDLVHELISLSRLPFTDKDKELIYYLILTSPGALKELFTWVYSMSASIERIINKHGHERVNDFLLSGPGEREAVKNDFIDSLQVYFIKEVKEYYNIPNFNIEININVKFKDEAGKKVYEFSNEIEGAGDNEGVNYPYVDFI